MLGIDGGVGAEVTRPANSAGRLSLDGERPAWTKISLPRVRGGWTRLPGRTHAAMACSFHRERPRYAWQRATVRGRTMESRGTRSTGYRANSAVCACRTGLREHGGYEAGGCGWARCALSSTTACVCTHRAGSGWQRGVRTRPACVTSDARDGAWQRCRGSYSTRLACCLGCRLRSRIGRSWSTSKNTALTWATASAE